MAASRFYSNTAQPTTLLASCINTDTVLSLVSIVGFPASYPFTLVIDGDNLSAEVVTVSAVSGSSVTVARGQDGTTAVSHSIGASVVHDHTARDFQDSRNHEAATAAHGATGQVVGTTNTQNLTNKTILAGTASTVAEIVKGAGSQTANLTEWRDAANNVLANIDPDGNFQTRADVTSSTLNVAPITDAVAVLIAQNGSSNKDLLQIEDGAGDPLVTVDKDGNVSTIAKVTAEHISTQPTDSSHVALLVQKMAASSADIVEVQDDSGDPLVTVDHNGAVAVVGDITGATLFTQPLDSVGVGVATQAFAGSSAALFSGRNSGGTLVYRVNNDGFVMSPSTSGSITRTTASFAKITSSVDEDIPNTIAKRAQFDTQHASTNDSSMVDLTLNRLIAPRDGTYVVSAQVLWDADVNGHRDVRIVLNGTSNVAQNKKPGSQGYTDSGGDPQNVTAVLRLVAGDFVYCEVVQNSGAHRTLTNVIGPVDNSLAMGWVAP